MRDIFNNADHLFYYDTTKSLQLYAQNQWHDVEVLKKEEIELPGTGRQFAFLLKPINGPYLRLPGTGSTATSAADAFAGITANDPAMQKIIATAKKASRMATTVLIEGESGTGKEMIAQGIHLASGRKGPFIVINCGSIPRELL